MRKEEGENGKYSYSEEMDEEKEETGMRKVKLIGSGYQRGN